MIEQLVRMIWIWVLCIALPGSIWGGALVGQQPVGPIVSYQAPSMSVRTMAEWEEVSHLVLVWSHYQQTIIDIVRAARSEVDILILCHDSLHVKQHFQLLGEPLAGIQFLQTPINSPWIRDYGPQSVYSLSGDSLMLLDWRYNRQRPADDTVSYLIAAALNLPCISMSRPPFDFVQIGGNFLVDGMGTAFSSDLVLAENEAGGAYNFSQRHSYEIDALMYRFLGIKRFIKLPALPYDPIHHLDMQVKLLNEETLLVGRYPFGIADGPFLERYVSFFKDSLPTGFGGKYRVVRIPMPAYRGNYPDHSQTPYQSYANAVIVNQLVMVPLYGSVMDTLALRIYRKEMPGYRVVGIDCQQIIQANGALHCITQTIGVKAPLRMLHPSPPDPLPAWSETILRASASHPSGIKRLTAFIKPAGARDFSSIPMHQKTTGDWEGILPGFAPGTRIQYYLEGEAYSGKIVQKPITAPKGYYQLRIGHNSMR